MKTGLSYQQFCTQSGFFLVSATPPSVFNVDWAVDWAVHPSAVLFSHELDPNSQKD